MIAPPSPMGSPNGAEPVADTTAPPPVSQEKLDALCRSLDDVKVARPAAVQVIACVDDPNANAAKVAKTIETDPGLTAQIMRLANSAFYGVSGRVGNTSFAVTVIGFSAARSMAAVNATGLDRPGVPLPPGFWRHAAESAAACSSLAPMFGVPPGDAFAAGLLHDLGTALLHGFDTEAHKLLLAEHGDDGLALRQAEEATFGLGHDDAAARVLLSWRFPSAFVDAVAGHHVLPADPTPFTRVIAAGDVIASMLGRVATEDDEAMQVLSDLGVAHESADEFLESTAERANEIMASLPTG